MGWDQKGSHNWLECFTYYYIITYLLIIKFIDLIKAIYFKTFYNSHMTCEFVLFF